MQSHTVAGGGVGDGDGDVTPATLGSDANGHVGHILKRYPDLLAALSCSRYQPKIPPEHPSKGGRRTLRRGLVRWRKQRRLRALCRPGSSMLRRFESALADAMNATGAPLFKCPLCRNVLSGPVTAECGHTFCTGCLQHSRRNLCAVCDSEIGTARCTNVLVQELIEKWQERNRADETGRLCIPNTSDILGIGPRYHLRSRFAGLQMTEEDAMDLMDLGRSPKPDISTERFDTTISDVFREVETIQQRAIRSCWDLITVDDMECTLCSRFFFEPVTTACGHTFCKGCLTRVLDHGWACPLCKSSLSVKDYSRGSNAVLEQAIQFLLPEEHVERLMMNAKEVLMLNQNCELPVFVCTNAFPGVACPLYVYEPRYRLLVRRCLMSPTRTFAMAAKEEGPGDRFVSYGTVLEVKDVVYLEDGSFILTTVGVRRFKVVSRGEQDGYDTAKVQFIRDTVVSVEKLPELLNLHQKVHKKASEWINSLTPKILAEVERLIGQMPEVEKNCLNLPDGPLWTWWLMPILPINSHLQLGFLSTTNLEKRLRAIDKMLERMEIRMKALERNTLKYSSSEGVNDSCADSERSFEVRLNSS